MGTLSRFMQQTAAPSMPSIRVRASLTAALNMLTAEWREAAKIILAPYTLMILGWLPVILILAPIMQGNDASYIEPKVIMGIFLQNIHWFVLGTIISVIINAYMVTGLARFFILSQRAKVIWAYHDTLWSMLWRQILMTAAIMFVMAGVFMVTAFLEVVLPGLGTVIAGLIAAAFIFSVLFTRVSLAPFAAAVGEDPKFRTSWHNTRGQVMRISMVWLGFFLVSLCVGLVSGLLEIALGVFPETIKTVLTVVKSILVSGGIFAFATALQTVIFVHFYHRASVTPQGGSHVL